MRVPAAALTAPLVLTGVLAASSVPSVGTSAPATLRPDTADTVALDTALARFVGTWALTAHETPIGDFTATLVVAPDTGSVLSIPALAVDRARLAGLAACGDTLDVPAAFFATPPGDLLSTGLRLVRTAPDTLTGAWSVAASDGSDIGTFRTTAVRTGR